MNDKPIKLTLNNKNEVRIGEEIIKEIDKEKCWITAIVELPDNYVSEIFITIFGPFHRDYRKITLTIYKNENDGHPNNVIHKNETVVKTSNTVHALLGKQIFRKETGEPLDYIVVSDC